MSVNDQQVGGNHYKSSFQHWDFVEDNGIGYLEGCATKYVTRHRKKNGTQDLEKANHYVDKLISLQADGRKARSGHIDKERVIEFAVANNLNEAETTFCELLCKDWDIDDLHAAKVILGELIEETHNKAQRVDETGMKNPFGYQED